MNRETRPRGAAPTPPLPRVLRPLHCAVEIGGRLRGLLCRPRARRRSREAASFRALCARPRFAALGDYEDAASPIRDALRPHYDDYTSAVSPAWMAVSLELAVFLTALCTLLKPRRIADLGSGYSSFVFRRYQQACEPAPEVWSVDRDPVWLQATRRFLERHELGTDHLMTWDAFAARRPRNFDLILHDLGSLRVRSETLRDVLALAAPGGAVVLDDLHGRRYRRHVLRVLSEQSLEHHRLEAVTRDRYGRYAMLVTT